MDGKVGAGCAPGDNNEKIAGLHMNGITGIVEVLMEKNRIQEEIRCWNKVRDYIRGSRA